MDAMTVAAIAMQDDMQRLNNISQNLANVGTLGYKRHIAVSKPFADFLGGDTAQASNGSLAAAMDASPGSGLPGLPGIAGMEAALDMRSGTLRPSSNPLDLAIEGDGFFEVSSDNGSAWARQGTMRVDARGHLVTQQGFQLAGVNGDIRPNGGAVSISVTGEVRQGERTLGQIRLVRFDNPGRMQSLGNGLYAQGLATLADIDPARASKSGNVTPPQLRAGYQENSNVNSAEEMVRLTETVRHFEAMQKVMQGYGDVFEQTLRKLGEF